MSNNNTNSIGAKTNFGEKMEDISQSDWMERLHSLHTTRADMNQLIMNYLVTGVEVIIPLTR